jgi:hypothetical protein
VSRVGQITVEESSVGSLSSVRPLVRRLSDQRTSKVTRFQVRKERLLAGSSEAG